MSVANRSKAIRCKESKLKLPEVPTAGYSTTPDPAMSVLNRSKAIRCKESKLKLPEDLEERNKECSERESELNEEIKALVAGTEALGKSVAQAIDNRKAEVEEYKKTTQANGATSELLGIGRAAEEVKEALVVGGEALGKSVAQAIDNRKAEVEEHIKTMQAKRAASELFGVGPAAECSTAEWTVIE